MHRSDRSARRAFTTVEMLAVLVLAGVLSALATLSLAGPRKAADWQEVMDHVAYADALARDAARMNHRPGRVAFEMGEGRILDAAISPERELYRLPAGWNLDRLLLARGAESFDAMKVAISAAGLSRSYAVRVSHRGESSWIVVNGITGQAKRVADEQTAIDRLEPSGDDAH